jgi:polysaccharide pyruvyl transferase WcaK-like protein
MRSALGMRLLWEAARVLGYRVINAAYDLSKIDFYRECDLHVGYRVHAQIDFLSYRHPSVLLNEDGRGEGLSQSLGLKGIRAYDNPDAVREAVRLLRQDLSSNFSRFHAAIRRMQAIYESAMLPFLQQLP